MKLINSSDTQPSLDDPSLKVDWAKHHLHALDNEIRGFLNGKPYRVWAEDDLDASEYIVQFRTDPMRAAVGLILGDFVSCLRASLDHLAFQLTLCPRGTRNEKAFFPIIDTDDAEGARLFKKGTKGVPLEAAAVIDSLQPHRSGDAYKLTKMWKLHRLWNIDKHRRIPFHAHVAQIFLTYPTDFPPVAGWTDNSGIVRFPLAAKPYVKLQPSIHFDIQFGDESEGIVVSAPELTEIYQFIHDEVLPRFERFFS